MARMASKLLLAFLFASGEQNLSTFIEDSKFMLFSASSAAAGESCSAYGTCQASKKLHLCLATSKLFQVMICTNLQKCGTNVILDMDDSPIR